MNLKKTILFSIILSGISAITAQIIFVREFLVIFYGNEVSIGIVLAAWLMWTAFGSWILGRFSDYIHCRIFTFSVSQLALSITLPLTFFLIRISKSVMAVSPGEIIGYSSMIPAVFVILSVVCAVMGFMFSLACRIYRDIVLSFDKSIAGVYVFEALGALIGGLFVSCFLIRFIQPFYVIFFMSCLNIIAAFAVSRFCEIRNKKYIFLVIAIIFISAIILLFTGACEVFRKNSIDRLWHGFTVVESKNSVYGNAVIVEEGNQRSVYENGLHLCTAGDKLSSEETAHYALLMAENPKDILLIGGGYGGILEEILKYSVKKIDYVELDPMIVDLAKKHLRPEYVEALNRPEVNIINGDGRFFIKKAAQLYDCVIINLADPYTAQINRFYTVQFFRELSRLLKDGAVVSFGLTSSENYVGRELQKYLRSIYLTCRKVFREVIVFPGDTAYFFASNTPGIVTSEPEKLVERLNMRNIETKYVREYYLKDKLSEGRVEYMKSMVNDDEVDVRLNNDFWPISYYYAAVFWATRFDAPFFRKIFLSFSEKGIWKTIFILCVLILSFGACAGRGFRKKKVLLAVMTTAFAEINFQMAVILSFQFIYGYVFYKIGIMFSSFMIGLAIGGWVMAKRICYIKNPVGFFSRLQLSICVYPVLLPFIFMVFSRTQSCVMSWTGSNIIFPMLPVIAGMIGGMQFLLAAHIWMRDENRIGRVAGLIYGLDLLGAGLGALLASAVLIPILGIFQTCFAVALINLVVFVALARNPYAVYNDS